MVRILVCGDDQLTILRVGRVLSVRNLPFDIEKNQIRKDELDRYDLIIVHSSWKMPHVAGFIENVLHEQRKPIVYLTADVGIGMIRPLLDEPFFVRIDDQRIDAELGVAVELLLKTAAAFNIAVVQAEKAAHRADLRRVMDECKKRLMQSGLGEAEAHALILKTAMDRQITKYDACALLNAQKKIETD